MGMFDKDKEMGLRLDQSFDLKEPFIVWGARISDKKADVEIGDGTIAIITVSPLNDPGDQLDYNTIASAIVDKARLARPDEFPAVCELRRVTSTTYKNDDVLVLQYIKDYVA